MIAFDTFIDAISLCEGYLVERLIMSRIGDSDVVDISLRWGPDKPDVMLSFEDVYYFEVGGGPGRGTEPLYELTATVLEPSSEPWPDGINLDIVRSASLPALLWFRAGGPAQLTVLAAIATAYREVR
ncbi:hypothetical protein GCM10023196_107560 [Actinoallomurus vinaceus]|uniref:Uncharacterized protein n=1 Tax=Actinoallomurus vinaceus TaxID=1080074 RepID=A0ABP8UYV3_9ACTN